MSLFEKSCIVTTHNGVEVARKRVIAQQFELPRAYENVRARLAEDYPDHYIFCDSSEGFEHKDKPVTIKPTTRPIDLPPAIAIALGNAQTKILARKTVA